MKRLLSFLRSLRRANSFQDDPYGWATNQIAHAFFVGFGATTFAALIAAKVSGYWVDQRIIVFSVIALYAFAWEGIVQGWRGADTIYDLAFVALGASAYLLIDMAYVIERIVLWYIVLVAMLLPGILSRVARNNE